MAQLKSSKTHENLKYAFAGESQANRRQLYFAKQADIEGFPEIADWFETLAKAERSHAANFQKALDTIRARRPPFRPRPRDDAGADDDVFGEGTRTLHRGTTP